VDKRRIEISAIGFLQRARNKRQWKAGHPTCDIRTS